MYSVCTVDTCSHWNNQVFNTGWYRLFNEIFQHPWFFNEQKMNQI
jgi:hypothetical protein